MNHEQYHQNLLRWVQNIQRKQEKEQQISNKLK